MSITMKAKKALATDLGLTYEEINTANALADKIFGEMIDRAARQDLDPSVVAYGLFVSSTRILARHGWTADELSRDLAHHIKDQNAFDAKEEV